MQMENNRSNENSDGKQAENQTLGLRFISSRLMFRNNKAKQREWVTRHTHTTRSQPFPEFYKACKINIAP